MQTLTMRTACPVDAVSARAFEIPTEQPESDGTLQWKSTTMVYVEIAAAGETGIGYTYADAAAATLVRGLLAPELIGKDALQTAARVAELVAKVRNNGRGGISAMAISALDVALWDLKGKLLGAPVCALLGAARSQVPVYGSGGLTSYTLRELAAHMARWVHELGIPRAKMKIGRDPSEDPHRIAAARKAIGSDAKLFVDANGAYAPKEALQMAEHLVEQRVSWYEEPVYHRDLRANAWVRDRLPASMELSNGEYGYAPDDFAQILDAGAADVLQADVTRCGGFSGFLAVDALCDARNVPLSSHCAPAVTLHAALAARRLRHVEYFYDHVRIESMLLDGVPALERGALVPDLTRPGIGLELKRSDAERFAI